MPYIHGTKYNLKKNGKGTMWNRFFHRLGVLHAHTDSNAEEQSKCRTRYSKHSISCAIIVIYEISLSCRKVYAEQLLFRCFMAQR